jgi:hypothetical protein
MVEGSAEILDSFSCEQRPVFLGPEVLDGGDLVLHVLRRSDLARDVWNVGIRAF